MNPTSIMGYFMFLVMGYILGQLLKEATENYREVKRIKKEWEAMKKKELDHD